MEKDILQEIIAHKRIEIARQKEAVPEYDLEQKLEECLPCRSMKQALASSPYGIIAEFKRRSPSAGWIYPTGNASVIPPSYQDAGAAALSILTDNAFFGGDLKDLIDARQSVHLPILRKDFIIDRYQLLQAKLAGADAILLIATVLPHEKCLALSRQAHELNMEILLEIHEEAELEYVNEYIDMVGVNNRNLGTFHTDTDNSFRLATKLSENILKVSESGISNPTVIKELGNIGYQGFLIGETFMRTEKPGNTLAEFIKSLSL